MLANFSNLITFSRGSNATVTDASGRLTYAPSNLLTNSQDFESANWTKLNLAVTANTTAAPDGSVSADTFTAAAGTFGHSIRQLVTVSASTPYVFSVYAKAGTNNFIQLANTGDAQAFANFDLANGAVGSAGTKTAASITPAGNGWYRCSAAFNSTAVLTNDHRFYITSSASAVYGESWTTAGTETVFLWGAQLEAVTYQTTPSPYVSTSVANLLGFSEAFDNAAWTKSNSSIVPNAAQNPINNLWNAQKLMENTATSNHYAGQSVSVVSGVSYTLSFYAKQAGRNAVFEFASSGFGASKQAVFNLSTGTATPNAGVTASIVDVGNGWYRCSATCTATATTTAAIYCIMASGTTQSYTGDGNSGIYIYGAQLSNSGSLDPYVPTPGAAPSSTAYYGPRFDYDPVTLAAKGILIEEQRTNLFTYSQDFNGTGWRTGVGYNSVIATDTTTAPDGTVTADSIVADNAGGTGGVILAKTLSATSGTSYTLSFFAKAGTLSWIRLFALGYTTPANGGAYFNLGAGTIGTVDSGYTATIAPFGNGWYRCTLSFTAGVTVSGEMRLLLANADNDTAVARNGTSSVYGWGAQLEAGAFATSYIPTVASQVTRSADVTSITGSLFSQWYRQDEGTFVVSGAGRIGVGGSAVILATTSGGGSNLSPQLDITSSTVTRSVYTNVGGTIVANTNVTVASTSSVNNFAATFSAAGVAIAANGGTVSTTSISSLPAPSFLSIGQISSTQHLNGHIQNITYIPNAVSASQLQSATS